MLLSMVACGEAPPDSTDTTPQAPSNVTVMAGAGVVEVSWEHDGAGVTGFAIYRETVTTSTATAGTPLAEVGATERSFRDETVEAGVPYQYSVAAQGTGGRASSPTPHAGEPVAADEPLFELFAYVGTQAGESPDPTISFGLILRGPKPEVDTSVTVTVIGPAAWGTEEFEWMWRADWSQLAAGRGVSSKGAAVSGVYEVRATFIGNSITSAVTVDADLVLPKPTGLTLIRSAVDEMVLSWDPVPGAAAYTVTLGGDDFRYLYAGDSTVSEIALSGFDFDLDPSERYRVVIGAASVDVLPGVREVGEPAPSQQRDLVRGDYVCFYPGDEEFSDCD